MMEENEIKLIVDRLIKDGLGPSDVGHVLRDQYGVRIDKLTKFFPQLNQTKYEYDRLNLKIQYMKLHLGKNHKDYVTERALKKLTIKLIHLKARL